jgi:hypothetical protein
MFNHFTTLGTRVARASIVSRSAATIHALAVVIVASAVRRATVVAAFAANVFSGCAGPGICAALAIAAIIVAVAIDATAVGVLATDERVRVGDGSSHSEREESEGCKGEDDA